MFLDKNKNAPVGASVFVDYPYHSARVPSGNAGGARASTQHSTDRLATFAATGRHGDLIQKYVCLTAALLAEDPLAEDPLAVVSAGGRSDGNNQAR